MMIHSDNPLYRLMDSLTDKCMFNVVDGEALTEKALKVFEPKAIYGNYFFEGELACLFADTNLGKSIFAVQIGREIAKKYRVLYFDFEMKERQFCKRYTDSKRRSALKFPKNFMRATMPDEDFVTMSTDAIIYEIERSANSVRAEVLIIDNITWIASCLENTEEASTLMQQLISMNNRLGSATLCLAHIPKTLSGKPLTVNSLAGSKRIANFMDSIFAMGRCGLETGVNLRYIKQLKSRCAKFDPDAVTVHELVKKGANLMFNKIGDMTEAEALI